MAKIIQYDLNENVRGCLRKIFSSYLEKTEEENQEIENIYFTKEELKDIIDEFFIKVKDITEKSKKGILMELLPCLKEKEIYENNKNINVYYLSPVTNLLRLKDKKLENEVLYISLLKYATGFKEVNKIIFEILGPDRNILRSKDDFIEIIIERHSNYENTKPKPLSFFSIDKNARRSINNLITLNIILDHKTDKSLEDGQIRIKTYNPDYRMLLILYLEERASRNQIRPALDTLINDYDFVKFFFLNKQSLKNCLKPGLEKNLFYYQDQIGGAINEKFNEWEISKS